MEGVVGGAGAGVGGVVCTIFALERVIVFPFFVIVIVKVNTISVPLIV